MCVCFESVFMMMIWIFPRLSLSRVLSNREEKRFESCLGYPKQKFKKSRQNNETAKTSSRPKHSAVVGVALLVLFAVVRDRE